MASTTYDARRAEAFAGRMLDMLNGGALAVMISVGHRTGLFDALADARRRDEPGARRGRRARRALRARVARRDDDRPDRRARSRDGALLAARRARGVAHARGVARQPRRRRAVDPDALDGRGRHRRVLPHGRRRAVRAVRALPRGDGGGERADRPLGALLAHPSARPRHDRAARGGRVAPRPRLRARPCARCCSPSAFRPARSSGYDLSADAIAYATRAGGRARARERPVRARDLSTFDVDAEPGAFDVRHDLRRRARSGDARSRC